MAKFKKIKDKLNFRKMSRRKKILTIIIAAALIVCIVLLVRGRKSDEAVDMGPVTMPAEKMTITKSAGSRGEIMSNLKEKVTPHADYKLDKILVSEGESVKEGNSILTYTNGGSMVAPYDCVVIDWSLPNSKKELTNDHYVEIAGTRVLKMELNVSEDKIALVDKGDPATIQVGATDKTYKGEVSFVSDIGEYSDGSSTFKVDVVFDNDGDLKLGMNGKAKIILQQARNVICVPKEAVMDDGETATVTVMKGDKARDITVETGISNKNYVEIKSGLQEGDMVMMPY